MPAEISLKTKKKLKKFPETMFFDFSFAVLKTVICTYQGGAETVTVQRKGAMIYPPLDYRSNASLARI
jgi:hypothetical protein